MENLEVLYSRALEIARKAHEGQVDKGGTPYIEHALHVAEQVKTRKLKIIALLHDTLEDSDLTAEDLRREGFPEEIVEAVCVLTHNDEDGEAYEDYIARVAKNPMAALVKRADLNHNMDLSRIKNPGPRDRRRYEKYKAASQYLNLYCRELFMFEETE